MRIWDPVPAAIWAHNLLDTGKEIASIMSRTGRLCRKTLDASKEAGRKWSRSGNMEKKPRTRRSNRLAFL